MSDLEEPNGKLVRQLSPSARKVYEMLQTGERMFTTSDLLSKTHYSPRTIRYAIRQLSEADLIVKVPDIMDLRRCFYTVA